MRISPLLAGFSDTHAVCLSSSRPVVVLLASCSMATIPRGHRCCAAVMAVEQVLRLQISCSCGRALRTLQPGAGSSPGSPEIAMPARLRKLRRNYQRGTEAALVVGEAPCGPQQRPAEVSALGMVPAALTRRQPQPAREAASREHGQRQATSTGAARQGAAAEYRVGGAKGARTQNLQFPLVHLLPSQD